MVFLWQHIANRSVNKAYISVVHYNYTLESKGNAGTIKVCITSIGLAQMRASNLKIYQESKEGAIGNPLFYSLKIR